MHPIPDDLDLSAYVGAELGALVLGPYAITFDFYPKNGTSPGAQDSILRIVAEGPWMLHNAAGDLISDSVGYAQREPSALHALLASRVSSVAIDAPEKIAFSFDTGHRLSLFTEIGGFESLSIGISSPQADEFTAYIF